MSSKPEIAISVRGLSKAYTIRHNEEKHSTLAEAMFARLKNPLHRPKTETFWALKDISFDINKGDVVGIIGRNGAGKSTLLKILSRITEPTTGQIDLYGRVGSLLEVGTGFHPELTGRENVFLNGAILGMSKTEIKKQFGAIVDFAEVEKFLDTPVKRYSSGMYVRLAFAVAAHLNPEILIVDEVLAVGDGQFQKKCLGKMGEVAKQGRTVLFVSHNMTAVQSLCQNAMLLAKGQLQESGSTATIVRTFLSDLSPRSQYAEWGSKSDAPGTDSLRIKRITVTRDGEVNGDDGLLTMDSPIRIITEFWTLKPTTKLHITYHLINDQGITVLTTGSPSARRETGVYSAVVTFPGHFLNSGRYFLKLFIVEDENRPTYRHEAIASFEVVDAEARQTAHMHREPGVVQPLLPWSVLRANA